MKTPTVITNLRIPKPEWLQVKTSAAELGMSVNEFVNYLIRKQSQNRQLAGDDTNAKRSIWDIAGLAQSSSEDAFSLSEDDEAIYG